jgi:hypothetical protein
MKRIRNIHNSFYEAHLRRWRMEWPPAMMLLSKQLHHKEATDGEYYRLASIHQRQFTE